MHYECTSPECTKMRMGTNKTTLGGKLHSIQGTTAVSVSCITIGVSPRLKIINRKRRGRLHAFVKVLGACRRTCIR